MVEQSRQSSFGQVVNGTLALLGSKFVAREGGEIRVRGDGVDYLSTTVKIQKVGPLFLKRTVLELIGIPKGPNEPWCQKPPEKLDGIVVTRKRQVPEEVLQFLKKAAASNPQHGAIFLKE